MSECTAEYCGKELADGIYLCHTHASRLETALADIPAVWEDLRCTVARLDRAASSPGGGGAHQSSRPPVNLDAMDQAQSLRVLLSGWSSYLPILRPIHAEPPAHASLLADNMNTVRHCDWAGDLLRELLDALRECRFAMDRAADRISVGRCGALLGDATECPGTLRAIVGATTARCRDCGGSMDVRQRQQWAISEAWHVWGFLPDIVRWLALSGHARIDIEKAKKWVQRGKLDPTACDVASRRHLFTPAAVMATYRETPTGRRAEVGENSLVA